MKNMTNRVRHTIISIILIAIASTVVVAIYFYEPPYDYRIFRAEKGWGYEIIKRGKVFIRKEDLYRDLGGGKISKRDAEHVAREVCRRMKDGEPMELSADELAELLKRDRNTTDSDKQQVGE